MITSLASLACDFSDSLVAGCWSTCSEPIVLLW